MEYLQQIAKSHINTLFEGEDLSRENKGKREPDKEEKKEQERVTDTSTKVGPYYMKTGDLLSYTLALQKKPDLTITEAVNRGIHTQIHV